MIKIAQCRVGMLVYVTNDPAKYAGVWEISKVNRVNVMLTKDGRRLNCAPYFLSLTPPSKKAVVTFEPYVPSEFVLGAVVSMRGKVGKFVVVGVNSKTVSVAKLNGDNGRYWRTSKSSLKIASAA